MKTSSLIFVVLGFCAAGIQARTVYRSVQPYDIPVKVVYEEQVTYEKRDLKSDQVPVVDAESQLKLDPVPPTKFVASYDEEKNVVKVDQKLETVDTKTKVVSEVLPEHVNSVVDTEVTKDKPVENVEANSVIKDPVVSETKYNTLVKVDLEKTEVLNDQIAIETKVKPSESTKNVDENKVKTDSVVSVVKPIESFDTEKKIEHVPTETKSEVHPEKTEVVEVDQIVKDTVTSGVKTAEPVKVDSEQKHEVITEEKPEVDNVVKVASDEDSSNSLRNSESHPAQIPNLKSPFIDEELSRDANGTKPNGTFANFQQSISNVIENIRPAHVVQVVVDRFSNRNASNSTEQSNNTLSGFQQTITNAIEMIRPANVVQAVVDRFSNRNGTNQTKEETQNENGTFVTNFQQSINNVIENIRPAHVVQVVVDRFSNKNNTDNKVENSTSSNSTFSNIQHAITNALEAVRPVNVFQTVVDRFSNRNNTNNKNSTAPLSHSEITNLQAEVNKTVTNFKNSISQAFKEATNSIRAANETSDSSGSRPILESIQANFNQSVTNFANNIDKLFHNLFNSTSNSTSSNSTSTWQSFLSGMQHNIMMFAQSIIPNFNSNSTTSSNSTQSDSPINSIQQTISNGFQSFVGNMNQLFTGSNTQNDQASSPFQTIGNIVTSIFRPESQSDTQTPSNSFNPVQAISTGLQSIVNAFRPSNDPVAPAATHSVSDVVAENQVVADQPEGVVPSSQDTVKVVENKPNE